MLDEPDRSVSQDPDPDLVEYLLVTAPSVEQLRAVVPDVLALVESGSIRLIDGVVLTRLNRQASVTALEVRDVAALEALAAVVGPGALLSVHDVELAGAILGPDAAALLLLIEDRWAAGLSTSARQAGGRIFGGERVVGRRFLAARGSHRPASSAELLDAVASRSTGRAQGINLLARSPAIPDATGSELGIDPVAQLRALADLADGGVISVEQYDDQRRRALEG